MIGTIAMAATGALGAGLVGGLMTEIGPWYRALRKPPWQPPDWLFGPAWTIILGLAGWSFVLAWSNAANDGARERVVLLFAANLVFHLLWTPLFFRLKRPDWALVEVVFLWCSLVALVIGLAPISALASWLLAPYLAWVSFAFALNLAVVKLNRPFGRN
jgi:benzodiazapine receptor